MKFIVHTTAQRDKERHLNEFYNKIKYLFIPKYFTLRFLFIRIDMLRVKSFERVMEVATETFFDIDRLLVHVFKQPSCYQFPARFSTGYRDPGQVKSWLPLREKKPTPTVVGTSARDSYSFSFFRFIQTVFPSLSLYLFTIPSPFFSLSHIPFLSFSFSLVN